VRKRLEEFMKIEVDLRESFQEAERKGVRTEISPILKTRDEVKKGSLLFLDFIEEAKILYDKDGFFLPSLRNSEKGWKS
jgi:hypothetical protein